MGTLRGFDDYVNMVLDDVTEYEVDADGTKRKVQLDQVRCDWQYCRVLLYLPTMISPVHFFVVFVLRLYEYSSTVIFWNTTDSTLAVPVVHGCGLVGA